MAEGEFLPNKKQESTRFKSLWRSTVASSARCSTVAFVCSVTLQHLYCNRTLTKASFPYVLRCGDMWSVTRLSPRIVQALRCASSCVALRGELIQSPELAGTRWHSSRLARISCYSPRLARTRRNATHCAAQRMWKQRLSLWFVERAFVCATFLARIEYMRWGLMRSMTMSRRLSVCLSRCAKAAERIDVLFGVETHVGDPRNKCMRWKSPTARGRRSIAAFAKLITLAPCHRYHEAVTPLLVSRSES